VKLLSNQAELVKHLTDRQLLFHLYITQLALLVISAFLSLFLFSDFNSFKQIWELNFFEIVYYGGITGTLVILFDLLLMKLLPKHYFDDGGINDRVFQKLSYFHILVLSLIIAVTEEWLFRGVIQTHYGIITASVLFALLHVRYLKKWVLLTIVISLSFLLGWLYEMTQNLYVTIFAHFLIDFIFGVKIRIEFLRSEKGCEDVKIQR
jgi:membrane protease YdiL (CAAX protease family)